MEIICEILENFSSFLKKKKKERKVKIVKICEIVTSNTHSRKELRSTSDVDMRG